ncbi:unnamed protein product, partial [Musa banksii]
MIVFRRSVVPTPSESGNACSQPRPTLRLGGQCANFGKGPPTHVVASTLTASQRQSYSSVLCFCFVC